jgi:hypothetical protein
MQPDLRGWHSRQAQLWFAALTVAFRARLLERILGLDKLHRPGSPGAYGKGP